VREGTAMLESVTILGTGTIIPVAGRKCAGYLLNNSGSLILLDCGPGVLCQLADLGIDYSKLNTIMVTHFHSDHISDLFSVIISLTIRIGLAIDLTVIGPPGLASILLEAKRFLYPNQSDYRPDLLVIREVGPGTFPLQDLRVHSERTMHTAESLCYRIEDAEGRVLFYSGDTDYEDQVVRLGTRADISILECSHSDQFPDQAGHMTWSKAKRFYDDTRPHRLVLTHFYEDFLAEGIHTKPVGGRSITFANDKDVYWFTAR